MTATFTVSDSWEDQGDVNGTVAFVTQTGTALVTSITSSVLSAELVVGVPYSAVFSNITWNGWSAAIPPFGFFAENSDTVSLRALAPNLNATLAAPFNPPTPSAGGGSGSVTSVSVEAANGFDGSVASGTTTPEITIETSVSGLLKGDGTGVSAGVSGTDYLDPGPPVIVNPDGDYPVFLGDETTGSNITWKHPEASVDGRLNQRANGEIVWSANVDNSDTIDDSSQPAAKFSMDMANAAMTFQNSPAGYSSWNGNSNAGIDLATGDWTFDNNVAVNGALTIGAGTVPESSSDTGTPGQIAYDSSYLYICVAANTWTRVALAW